MDAPAPDLAHSDCTCFQARRLARLLTQHYDRAFAPLGLNVNRYSILRHAEAGQTITRLAARLGMERSTLSRDLRPLLEAGWLELQREADGRSRQVRLTPSGRALLRRGAACWRNAQSALAAGLGQDATRALNASLAGAAGTVARLPQDRP
ncbi:MarR family winged helix-turn-helix transcriptional regulator [Luteimonas sp. Y-2-2-4F]|nr:MarR family winged helix-turn-helix transcriptional regulator [Luteimonas sp. Y-2-2-4F]MCD9031384.1 MarR family winged helix-turn-helix transcriptional regulator [Luteimonas sp. Y-2-2-4F]